MRTGRTRRRTEGHAKATGALRVCKNVCIYTVWEDVSWREKRQGCGGAYEGNGRSIEKKYKGVQVTVGLRGSGRARIWGKGHDNGLSEGVSKTRYYEVISQEYPKGKKVS